MEAMLGDQLAEAEAEDGIGPLLSEEEAAEEAAVAAKLEEAMALNAQLKAMMIQAEEAELQERMRQQPRGGTRGGMPRGTAAPGSGPRMPGTAKNGGWGGQTHTDGRAREINRDNAILVQKLSNIAYDRRKPGGAQTSGPFHIPANRTSASINRRTKDDKIARENAAMAKRLNSVKATSNVSRAAAQKHASQHNQYLKVLGGQGPRGGSAAMMGPPAATGRARSAARNQQTLPALRMHTDGPRPFEF